MSDSPINFVARAAALSGAERILLITPGPHGAAILPRLVEHFRAHRCTVLEFSRERLVKMGSGLRVQARATRLPFRRHSFDAILSFESLYAIRPPWTVIAEFHRVLVPDGKLVLLEPASHGVFSALRDKVAGPGKRVFSRSEIERRFKRGDFVIREFQEAQRVAGMAHPANVLMATKRENPAEPAPKYKTAKEMIEARKLIAAKAPSAEAANPASGSPAAGSPPEAPAPE